MRKLYYTLLILLAGIFLFTNTAQAQTQPSGSGTLVDPYLIATFDNLHWIATNSSSWDKHFIQTADIDASATSEWASGEGWVPIGNSSTYFTGSYDGDNYSITHIFIDDLSDNNIGVGLFGYTGQSAVIKNLSLTNLNVYGSDKTAGVVGINRGKILNCHSSGTISGYDNIGGIVGANISGSTVVECSSNCDIEGDSNLGILVGYNVGEISLSFASGGIVKGLLRGGVIGGLVGYNFGEVNESYTEFTVTVSSDIRTVVAGGFIGENYGDLIDCFSRGPVASSGTNAVAGGFVGINNGSISQCYSTGLVTGNTGFIGGLVAENYGTVSNSFWDTTTSGTTVSDGGTGKSSFYMKQITTYTGVGWSFACEKWGINGSDNGAYPFLLWQNDYGYAPGDCNYWTGSSNSSWTTSGNWIAEEVPGSTDNTLIRSGLTNYPEISSSVTMNLIHIGTDAASLTINPGGSLTVTSNLINNSGVDGLVLKSTSATNSASIILDNANNDPVPATVERYVPGTNVFHIISPPVSGQSIADFIETNKNTIVSSPSGYYGLAPYKSTGDGWGAWYYPDQAGDLEIGAAYMAGIKSGTLIFKGNLINEDVQKSLTTEGFLWNGIGNPFASSFAAKTAATNFLTEYGDQLHETYYGLYIWDPAGQYMVINGTPTLDQDYIASAQGFMVKTKETGGTVYLERAMRYHRNDATFHKSEKVSDDWHKLILQVENASSKIQTTALAFNLDMTSNLDVGYDAGLLTDSRNAAFNLFTKMPVEESDLKLMVQALPSTWDEIMVIPIGLQHNAGGEVTFSVSSIDMPDDITVWLEDRDSIFTAIDSDNYTVTIPANADSLGRFYLHIGRVVTEVEITTTDDLSYCEDEVVDVTFTASTDGVNYQWFRNEVLIPEATSKTYNASEEGSFKVMVFVGGSSAESEPKMIIVNALPTVIIPNDFAVCLGEEITLTATGDADLFEWDNDVINGEVFTPTETTTYTVNATNTTTGCQATAEVTITVNPLPEVDVPDSFEICFGESVTLTATGDADLFEWDNDVINGEEFTPTETATYTVTATVTATGCQTTEEVTLTVNPLPEVEVSDNFEICFGESVTLIATGNANTYEWDNDVVNGEEFTPTETATYTVTATITATGCQTTEEVTITVNPLPEVEVPDSFEICFGEPVTLTTTGDADLFEWDNDVVNGEEFTPTETATYTVTATVTATGCQTTEEVTITVNPLPELSLASDDVSITLLEEYLFDAGEGFESYLWFDGSNEQTYLFVGSDWGIGVYDVWAEITNDYGCSTRDSAVVKVGPTSVESMSPWNFRLYPNPSSGEFNLDISGLNSQKVNVTILNSIGNLVYQKEYLPSDGVLQDVIKLRDKAKGVYLITINDGKNKITRRIVIN